MFDFLDYQFPQKQRTSVLFAVEPEVKEQERKFHGLAALGEELLGEEGEVRFDEQDYAIEGPVAAPVLGGLGGGFLEGVVGETDGDEEGEGEVNEARQHGFNYVINIKYEIKLALGVFIGSRWEWIFINQPNNNLLLCQA